jgi:hypothetical protein
MGTLLSIIVRLFLVAAGLVFAASVAAAATIVAAAWLAHAGWARLTGKPVRPFVARFRVRPSAESRTPRADAVRPLRGSLGDVMDVEAK